MSKDRIILALRWLLELSGIALIGYQDILIAIGIGMIFVSFEIDEK